MCITTALRTVTVRSTLANISLIRPTYTFIRYGYIFQRLVVRLIGLFLSSLEELEELLYRGLDLLVGRLYNIDSWGLTAVG